MRPKIPVVPHPGQSVTDSSPKKSSIFLEATFLDSWFDLFGLGVTRPFEAERK